MLSSNTNFEKFLVFWISCGFSESISGLSSPFFFAYFYFYFYFIFTFVLFSLFLFIHFLFLSFQRIASLIQVIIEFDSRGCVGRMLESHHKSYFGVIPYTLVKCFCLSIYISFRMKYHILWIFVDLQ